MTKICTREQAATICQERKAQGLKIGYTSGVFDLLHPGHIDYLEKARSYCDFLIVGVNSDASVRENKGELRPIVRDHDRARIVAALSVVDLVFIFSEKNNATNVTLLQPAIYMKAGDYKKEQLTSAGLVESYGGKVVLIPPLAGYSTSSIIDKISLRSKGPDAINLSLTPPDAAPAVFLDRDGTINQHVEYLSEPEKFELLPGVIDALKKLRAAGFRLVIVTNQPGIGLGYFTKEDFFRVNRKMLSMVREAGLMIDKIYFCPHSEAQRCSCRKPNTALVERGIRELNIIREKSYVIGDMTSDLLLAKNSRCRGVLVKTGIGGGDKRYDVTADCVAQDLNEAADFIIKYKNS